jgi:exonuclease III
MIKNWKYGTGKTNEKILITAWNINGIRTAFHKPSVTSYLKSSNADIVCLV